MSGVKLESNRCESGVPSAIQLESAPCPLGCAPNDAFVIEGRDLLHALDGDYKIMRCTACGLKRTNPRPSPETIGYYYPDDYGPYKGTRVSGGVKSRSGFLSKLLSLVKTVFDNKSMAIPRMKPGKMLEIGCASGSYLHAMAQKGWEVEGVELSPSAARAARSLGYDVAVGALEAVSKPSACYDLIVGWMVLEHLHQPVQSLQKLARWAAPDARLAVSVPNFGSIEAAFFGARWYALQLPTHLYHYEPATIRKVMEAGGWEVERIFHHRSLANLFGSLGYWLRDCGYRRLGQAFLGFPERGGRLGALLSFPLALPLAWLGQTGRMTVWAKRK